VAGRPVHAKGASQDRADDRGGDRATVVPWKDPVSVLSDDRNRIGRASAEATRLEELEVVLRVAGASTSCGERLSSWIT
jgi:hypothetical protein